MATLGDRIREARQRMGLTQEELALRLGVSRPTVTQYESGRREPDNVAMLRSIAEQLDVSVDWLTGRKEPGHSTAADNVRDTPHDVSVILRASKQLTEEERQSVLDFIEFTRAQRRKRGEKLPEEASRVDDSGPKEGGRGAP